MADKIYKVFLTKNKPFVVYLAEPDVQAIDGAAFIGDVSDVINDPTDRYTLINNVKDMLQYASPAGEIRNLLKDVDVQFYAE